jgi:unsaturated chondroitin disaccharide hydrolase
MRSGHVLALALSALALLGVAASKAVASDKAQAERALQFAEKQLAILATSVGDTDRHPRTLEPDGRLRLAPPREWTSGFYPGLLWLLYEHTRKPEWADRARRATAALESQQSNGGTHDLGFMLYCSYGNGYRLTSDAAYKPVLLHAAETLSGRFHPGVGCIRSWDFGKWSFPVIIDNMMNLELLFWASNAGGDKLFRDVAVRHAQTTLKNHFRDDGSSFHVVSYDPKSGAVEEKGTHQGFAAGSAWARGQVWGLYGYTMTYRETKDPKFLAAAVRIADFLLGHRNLPADGVPYWDFDAPDIPKAPRDVSAAAIMASALLELATFEGVDHSKYTAAADRILASLSSPPYRSERVGDNQGFILGHSVGNLPGKSEIDVPITYADYYYVEALLRVLRGVAPARN